MTNKEKHGIMKVHREEVGFLSGQRQFELIKIKKLLTKKRRCDIVNKLPLKRDNEPDLENEKLN
ncbi:MAG: hypothetical protein LUE65_05680, partial [Clostridiales bacterium]|nr:hypothetical protein [Clostridiales bacterium]